MWCCESWLLTVRDRQRLQSVERSMLRRFAGPRRAPDEEYVAWLQRSTRSAEHARDSAGISSWNVQVAFRKWGWAGHVARMNQHRWASRLTFWRDSEWWGQQDHRTSGVVSRPMRSRQGHFSRWETELCKFSETQAWPDWRQRAGQLTTPEWNAFCKQLAAFACKSLKRREIIET